MWRHRLIICQRPDHKDGKYRLRRYSVVELMTEPKFFKLTDVNTFTQSDKYNNFQGNVTREFENLDRRSIGKRRVS